MKVRPRYVDTSLTQRVQGVKYASGKTLLVPLERYQYRDPHRWWVLLYDIVTHSLALYGIFKLVMEPVFYYTAPYLTRLWNLI